MVRRIFLVLVAAVATMATTMVATTPAGAAVRPFNPPQTVAGGCAAAGGDSVMSVGGSLFGFATCQGSSIRFFSRNPDGTVNPSEFTGFHGSVLGVAYDSTASYVLFTTGSDVHIGKRTHAGLFSSRVVDTGTGRVPTGDVIAKDGQWFGVWTKLVGPHAELFSAGSALPISRVTTSPELEDNDPTLAYSASTPVVVWVRDSSTVVTATDLYKAKFINGTWEAPQPFATVGDLNLQPDIHIIAGRTFVAWFRDGHIWVASNFGGSFSSRMFNTGGSNPQVAASTTGFGIGVDHVYVAWTAFGTVRSAFFAESETRGSVHMTWDGATVASDAFVIGVGGAATKGTVTYAGANAVTIRSQV